MFMSLEENKAIIRKGIEDLGPHLVVNFYDVIGALAIRSLPEGITRIGVGHHFLLHKEDYPCEGGRLIHAKMDLTGQRPDKLGDESSAHTD